MMSSRGAVDAVRPLCPEASKPCLGLWHVLACGMSMLQLSCWICCSIADEPQSGVGGFVLWVAGAAAVLVLVSAAEAYQRSLDFSMLSNELHFSEVL